MSNTNDIGTSGPDMRFIEEQIRRHGGEPGAVKEMGHHAAPLLWHVHPSHRARVVPQTAAGTAVPIMGHLRDNQGSW